MISQGRMISVGYEGRSLDELLDVLDRAGVEVLIDVRENPQSRKPGFSRVRLKSALEPAGIEYRHEPLLGNPKTNRDGFRSGDRSARRRFAARLDNGSREAFDEVIGLARDRVVALLCFERTHEECHRSAIMEKAQDEMPGLTVLTF